MFGVVHVFGVLADVGVWLVIAGAMLIMAWHLGLSGRRGRSRRIRVWVSWKWNGIDKAACSILGLQVSVDLIRNAYCLLPLAVIDNMTW